MRTFLLLAVILLPVLPAGAQILGSGTIADPYHGITTTDFPISGTKYFNATIGASAGTITVAAGSKLISLSTTASISITGTGRLTANGTLASPILFSVDTDGDGIFGESTENWGNIFITSSGTSSLDYCTVERGVRTGTRIAAFGGGLYLGGTGSVTVNHSTIRNCTAIYGGGICVASGSSPTITNTLITGNTANNHGGAVFISSGSGPVVSNCIIRSNTSVSTTLPGGSIASVSGAPKIINSNIINSTSGTATGKSIYLENSGSAAIVNTIVWGSTSHIALNGTSSSVFFASAIEGESYTGCINLNSTNTDPAGPNFINPVTGNYNLSFISPCRDAGTDSYTGITIPANDFAGNSRIGTTDIGAYEMIYSRWTGSTSTDWATATNWDESLSPGTRNIIIPSGLTNYPTLSTPPSFTLNSGLRMIMQPGSRATFNVLTNNGTIDLQSSSSGIASLMANSYSGTSGSLNASIFITGGSPGTGLYRWHYIAPPANAPTSVFTSINPYNLLAYDESKVTTSTEQGWQWHDGYAGTTGFTTLVAKNGYNVFNNTDAIIFFAGLTSLTTSMGQIDLPFSGSGTDTSLYGYKLVGNSLTCGINWDLVTRSNTESVRNAIYITTNGNVASYVNGVGTNGGTAHIPPMQGFFVKTRAAGTYITIGDNAREHNSTARFKSATVIPLVRLELSSSAGIKDESVIRLDHNGTMKFDSDYDAGKMFGPLNSLPMIYTVLQGEEYSINTIPWPESQTLIPVTLRIPLSGTYKIRWPELQGLEGSRVTLTDNSTGSMTDLSTASEYSFTSSSGKIEGRFIITIYSASSAINDSRQGDNEIRVYTSDNRVYVQPLDPSWDGLKGRTRIFSSAGKVMVDKQQEWFYTGEISEYDAAFSAGVYIIEITAGTKRFSKKVVITR